MLHHDKCENKMNISISDKEILDIFLNNSLQAQFLIRKDGIIYRQNTAGRHLLKKYFSVKRSATEINWKEISKFHEKLPQDIDKAFEGNLLIEQVNLSDQFGNVSSVEFQYFPIFTESCDINFILLTCLDFNKNSEHHSRKNDEYFSLIPDLSLQGILVINESLDVIYANNQSSVLFQRSKAELLSKNLTEILKDYQISLDLNQKDLCTENLLNNITLEIKGQDQKISYLSLNSKLIKKDHQTYIFFFIDDITKLIESNQNSKCLIESLEDSSIGIVMLSNQGEILYSNNIFNSLDFFCTCMNSSENILPSRQANSVNIFEMSDNVDNHFLIQLKNCIQNRQSWKGQIKSIAHDKISHTYSVSINKINYYQHSEKSAKQNLVDLSHYIVIFREITHEIELERQLRQAQKLEVIGTLAGGIAHDFNNILTAILGFAELSIYDLDESNPLYANIKQILNASQRAKELIGQILTFSRQSESKFRPLRIIPVIKESLKLLRASIPATIDINQKFQTKQDTILGDPTQIHQILMNLCTNSYHAMKDTGGRITILLSQEFINTFDEEQIGFKPGEYIHISISDTGKGIPQHYLTRIFDPYFTTKPAGEGTGLGLAVVHGIVLSMQGFIKVESTEQIGTTFHIYIPNYLENMSSDSNESVIYKGSQQKVLFIDDESSIIQIADQMLQKLNYTGICFQDSEKAYEFFMENPDSFDLIITDMTMPKISGIDLIQRIRIISDDIPIILCTGYSEFLTNESIEKFKISDYIIKPISLQELSSKINQVLNPDNQ